MHYSTMVLADGHVSAARELVRRRVERLTGPRSVPWSVVAVLAPGQIVLLLADPALLHTLAVLAGDWTPPPDKCFDAAVAALGTDLDGLADTARRVEELVAQRLPATLLDAALDAVVAGAPVEWAVVHAEATWAGGPG